MQQMPVLNGFEGTKKLREEGITAPIAALTACARPEDRERIMRIFFVVLWPAAV